jgi:hypothetical protein
MTLPGFSAEATLLPAAGRYRTTGGSAPSSGGVVAAMPPCHACDHILDLCGQGRLHGQICYFCSIGYCDPEDWKNPPDPYGTRP